MLLPIGCTQRPLTEDGAIRIANEAVSPITILSTLYVQNATLKDNTWYVSYNFEDGSGPVIIEISHISKTATHITLGDERDEIQEFMDYFQKGVEVVSRVGWLFL